MECLVIGAAVVCCRGYKYFLDKMFTWYTITNIKKFKRKPPLIDGGNVGYVAKMLRKFELRM